MFSNWKDLGTHDNQMTLSEFGPRHACAAADISGVLPFLNNLDAATQLAQPWSHPNPHARTPMSRVRISHLLQQEPHCRDVAWHKFWKRCALDKTKLKYAEMFNIFGKRIWVCQGKESGAFWDHKFMWNQFGPMTFKACIASLLLQDFSLRFHAWCQRIPILAEAAYRLCPKPSPAPSNRCPGSKPQNKTITDSVSSRTPLNFQKEVKILVEPVAFLVA